MFMHNVVNDIGQIDRSTMSWLDEIPRGGYVCLALG